jgi:MFS family permease
LLGPAGFVRGRGVGRAADAGGTAESAAPRGTRKEYRDFWLVWMTRLTVALSNVMVMTYLLYYLEDAVGHPDPTRGQFVIVVLASVCFTATAVASGWLSDRFRRRKALVVASMVVLAGAETVLMSWVSWPGALAGAAIFGLGYGIYLAIDQALINDVLPRQRRAARDLGVFNVANVLPQIIGPLVAAPLVAGAGFPALYALTAVVTLCGVVFVVPIRSVR